MDVSENSATPKSSILIGFSYKPSILGYPYFWKQPSRTLSFFSDFRGKGQVRSSRGIRLSHLHFVPRGDGMDWNGSA